MRDGAMIKLAESGDTNTKLHAHDGAGSIVMASHEQIEEEMHWKILYDPTSGRYYYEDERTGETTWDPPSHIAEVLVRGRGRGRGNVLLRMCFRP
mmetsp:Transcript_88331/g.252730  ORF Transcript_88331/g.252730 Transcript_88331/m.252730 type:complete len:95 (+) Transcript_88331:309-593(+)